MICFKCLEVFTEFCLWKCCFTSGNIRKFIFKKENIFNKKNLIRKFHKRNADFVLKTVIKTVLKTVIKTLQNQQGRITKNKTIPVRCDINTKDF